nr:uncharacterized protein LOC125624442 [Caretta caretta]
MPEDFTDGEDEEEEDELEESIQHTVLPDSQDLFLTVTEIPSQPKKAGEGTSAVNVSSLPPPFQRLSQIKRRKKHTCNEKFSELMQSSGTDRAQQNVWRDTVAQYKKAANEREDRRDDRDERWQQEDQRRHEATAGSNAPVSVDVHEWQQDHRLLLQPLLNHPPSSPSSIASTPRRPRTRGERLQAPNHSTRVDSPSNRRLSFKKF